MKILLMALNSKYIHSNLAIRYIEHYFNRNHPDSQVELIVKEYTINNEMDIVLQDLVRGQYDCIFASAYIWNIEHLNVLFTNYKKVQSDTLIVFGGPEVTFNAQEHVSNSEFLDLVIIGEGEKIFSEFVSLYTTFGKTKAFEETRGIVYRKNNQLILNEKMPLVETLDEIPFPYKDLSPYQNRILYYESSRGCPYNCTYCLSSTLKGVRYMSFERVKSDMTFFLERKVPQVKFVDRTFNASKKHALPILKYLIENDNGVTNFHFEITATLLDDDYFEILEGARSGLFQFEIGVQTTNIETMREINRPFDFMKLKFVCERLIQIGGIHLHLDLIAGLPYEDFESFLKSFDDVYSIGAEQLQLGFLKILKGTPISLEMEKHQYRVRTQAPYEVLFNKYISFDDMIRLKEIETLVEYYANSGKFKHSIDYFIYKYNKKPSDFYLEFAAYFRIHGYFDAPISTYRLYEVIFSFFESIFGTEVTDLELFRDILKTDYYLANLKGQRELFNYQEIPQFNNIRFDLLKNPEFLCQFWDADRILPTKQLIKNVEFITLNYDIINFVQSGYYTIEEKLSVIMFDYSDANDVKMHAIDMHYFITNSKIKEAP